jgi:adenylyltransferase/sulfurtransferase
MFTSEEKQRYDRHIRLEEVGEDGQERIKNSKVLVVGAGGLGCPVLQYLSAAGIGEIGVLDADKVSISNLQRQVLYSIKDIGKQKTTTSIEVLSDQNDLVKFNDYPFYLDKHNALDVIKKYDIVVDCTDNFSARYLINDACVILKKPFVYGALHKFEGQLSVFNYKNGPTYRCLYPNPPQNNEIPNCSEVGVIGVLPSLIGTLQATEVLKIILKIGDVLCGKILTYDTLKNIQQIISFTKQNNNITKLSDYDFSCKISNDGEILTNELKDWIENKKKFNLIDIREEFERDDYKLNDTHFIPMGEIMSFLNLIERTIPSVIYCQTGNKSKAVVAMLKKQGFSEVYGLVGGVHQWVTNELNS